MNLGTKAELIAQALEAELMKGLYPNGLPAQQELALRFSVCRATIRQAIARLSAKQLLTVHPRVGMHPTDRREWAFDQIYEVIGAHRSDDAGAHYLGDFLEARRLLLGEVFALACARRSDDDVGAIRFLIWDLDQTAMRRPGPQIDRCERDVLEAFVAATGSTVLSALFNSLMRLGELVPPPVPGFDPPTPSIPIRVYELLADYLERRASEPARQLALEALLQAHRQMHARFLEGSRPEEKEPLPWAFLWR